MIFDPTVYTLKQIPEMAPRAIPNRSMEPASVSTPVHNMHPTNAPTTAIALFLVSLSFSMGMDSSITKNGAMYWRTDASGC